MTFTIINHTIQRHLIQSFALLDEWFDRDPYLLKYKPEGSPSIAGLMKSIALNNHHLLQVDVFDSTNTTEPIPSYNLDIVDLQQTARHWRFPQEEEFEPDLNKLRRQLRLQLDQALFTLERCELLSNDLYHPLAVSDHESWDGFHRLYFIGLLIRQYLWRFESIVQGQKDTLAVR